MEGYGGPAQPSPTIGQCLNGGLGWLEVECNRCKTRASLPLNAIRRPRDTPIWKLEAALKCRSCKKGRYAPPVHMIKLTRDAGDHALQVGASRRGQMRARPPAPPSWQGLFLECRNTRPLISVPLGLRFGPHLDLESEESSPGRRGSSKFVSQAEKVGSQLLSLRQSLNVSGPDT